MANDLITLVNGRSVKTAADFFASLALQDQSIKIRYTRGGNQETAMEIPRGGGNQETAMELPRAAAPK